MNKVFKRLGYKKIKVDGLKFVVKKLTPTDFLDKEGVPFTIFSVGNPYAKFGEVWGAIKTPEEEKKQETEQKQLVRQVLTAGVVRFPTETQVEDYLQPDTLITALKLYEKIISLTLKRFLRPMVISQKQLLLWDAMAKRYGVLPIEVLMPNGGYSEIDAYIFNSLVLSEAIKHENIQAKKRAKRG